MICLKALHMVLCSENLFLPQKEKGCQDTIMINFCGIIWNRPCSIPFTQKKCFYKTELNFRKYALNIEHWRL